MKQPIDTKSLTFGLLLGVIVTMSIAATTSGVFRSQGPVGRYQITGTHSTAWILDTVTGQSWGSYDELNIFLNSKLNSRK